MMSKAYQQAGVDLNLAQRLKTNLKTRIPQIRKDEVIGRIGSFTGLFRPKFIKLKKPVLVATMDGVGTKLKLAIKMNRHQTIGTDLVNHCVNDILAIGAEPLFFLDYIAMGKLVPRVFHPLTQGMIEACKIANCAFLGGETAQLSNLYHSHEYDVAGTMIGVVDESKRIDGRSIQVGDIIIGFPSNGLHTNGYSLAQKILFKDNRFSLKKHFQELEGQSLGEILMRPHRSYQPEIIACLKKNLAIKGMAHITGGGLIENIGRILPKKTDALINRGGWSVPPLFSLLQKLGQLSAQESYRVFNMGIGFVLIVHEQDVNKILKIKETKVIGEIKKGTGKVKVA